MRWAAESHAPAQAVFFQSKDREVLREGKLLEIPEEPIETATGRRWLYTRKIPVLSKDGSPEHLLGISLDITERRENEEALRIAHEEHRRQSALIEKMALAGNQARTFTISFAEAAFDESAFAREVAVRFRTIHHVEAVDSSGFLGALEAMPLVFDEPFADASAIPMLALARTSLYIWGRSRT